MTTQQARFVPFYHLLYSSPTWMKIDVTTLTLTTLSQIYPHFFLTWKNILLDFDTKLSLQFSDKTHDFINKAF